MPSLVGRGPAGPLTSVTSSTGPEQRTAPTCLRAQHLVGVPSEFHVEQLAAPGTDDPASVGRMW
ncbi:hypothetical protein HGI15_10315 [Modestobacter lapidis]|nr:hypothetical protein [Modestobacter lapidis]